MPELLKSNIIDMVSLINNAKHWERLYFRDTDIQNYRLMVWHRINRQKKVCNMLHNIYALMEDARENK